MKFRTEVFPVINRDFISYKTKILSIGSCFADEIGKKLEELKFQISVNPFGVIFNPVSIAALLDESDILDPYLFVERDSLIYHHALHSEIHAGSKEEFARKLSYLKSLPENQIQTCNLLLLTFGTAWAYKHVSTGKIVANCHKVVQKDFEKVLLNLDELKLVYEKLFTKLLKRNSSQKILLTVSPVRHIKDGMHENNLSKSTLMLLCDFLVKRFEQVFYFPAYELVMDDLRDYRFYKKDLLHPTEQAVEYVFDKFGDALFSELTKTGIAIRREIIGLQNHRQLADNVPDKLAQKIVTLELEFESKILK